MQTSRAILPQSQMGQRVVPGRLKSLIGRIGWRDATCLFVLSTGRTGTTSLERLLNLSTEIAAFHEPRPFNNTCTNEALHHLDADPQRFARFFTKHRAGLIGSVRRQGLVYAETNNMVFLAPVISRLLPRARFIHLHRHPAEYVRSGMRRQWYAGHSWDLIRLHPAEDDPINEQWAHWGPFEKICWFWATANDRFLDMISAMPAERAETIAFADLFSGSTDVYRRLFEIIDIAPPPPFQAMQLLARPANSQQSGDFPLFEDWTTEQRQTLWDIAGPTMERLGYPHSVPVQRKSAE